MQRYSAVTGVRASFGRSCISRRSSLAFGSRWRGSRLVKDRTREGTEKGRRAIEPLNSVEKRFITKQEAALTCFSLLGSIPPVQVDKSLFFLLSPLEQKDIDVNFNRLIKRRPRHKTPEAPIEINQDLTLILTLIPRGPATPRPSLTPPRHKSASSQTTNFVPLPRTCLID